VIDAGPEAMVGGQARRRLALLWGIAVITVVRRAGRTKLTRTSMEIGPKCRVAGERPPADLAGLSAIAAKITSPAGAHEECPVMAADAMRARTGGMPARFFP